MGVDATGVEMFRHQLLDERDVEPPVPGEAPATWNTTSQTPVVGSFTDANTGFTRASLSPFGEASLTASSTLPSSWRLSTTLAGAS